MRSRLLARVFEMQWLRLLAKTDEGFGVPQSRTSPQCAPSPRFALIHFGWGIRTKPLLKSALAILCLAPLLARAQNGDKAGEVQPELVPSHLIPPAPLLTPEEQIKTFHLPPGFRAEIVASEPLVQSPVAMQFDHQGRLWVVEMKGYMPDVHATGEDKPIGDVVILEDTNGDGRMDRRTVFLDHLVMPRALMLFRDGAIVAEPPRLWFARDMDGDGKADEKILIAEDYATEDDPKLGPKANPEHASNGLMRALDNWCYSANHTVRYRWMGGSSTNWIKESTPFRGQWGLSQDNEGRLFYNSNSDQLRTDLLPADALQRNPNYPKPFGVNYTPSPDQRVWPARVNPGVNRGYQPGQLTAEGKLATYTAACFPLAYRGDQFPDEFKRAVFLCEPSANMVRCNFLSETDSILTGTNAFPNSEFLASTDERFRPVTLGSGPDGALYIVDLARGLIQHRIYLTSYLRKQTESRSLQAPTDRGRIYRIVSTAKPVKRHSKLSAAPETETLISRLSSPNGFWRDTAQRMLVERSEEGLAARLRPLVSPRATHAALGRIHLIWTLEGIGGLDLATVRTAYHDPDPAVATASIRAAEKLFTGPRSRDFVGLYNRTGPPLPRRTQLALLLALSGVKTPDAEAAVVSLVGHAGTNALWRSAALSGMQGRELHLLQTLATNVTAAPESRAESMPMFAALAQCVVAESNPERVQQVLDFAASPVLDAPLRTSVLTGVAAGLPALPKGKDVAPRQIPVATEPKALFAIRPTAGTNTVALIDRIEKSVSWPGKPVPAGQVAAPVLSVAEQASYSRGKELYTTLCGACHQPHGRGQEGLAPPLLNSEWALGSPQRLARIVLHGLRDSITVGGTKYSLNMPALGEALTDEQIADALTYVRNEWGHHAAAVHPDLIKTVRAAEAKRDDSWTEPELLKVP